MPKPPKPFIATSRSHRLIREYRGPIVRVKLADGREVDVYDDDPAIDVPIGALRFAQLETESMDPNSDAVVLHVYNQASKENA